MAKVELRYGRGSFLVVTALLLLMTLMLIILLSSFSAGSAMIVPAALIALAAVVIYGVVPMFTYHYIEDGTLVLRQGLFFRGRVPLSNIREVERVERGPWRTGVLFNLRGARLYVTTRRNDLIMLKLTYRQRFGSVFGKGVDTIIFDCVDIERALRALSETVTPANRSLWSADRPLV
ncbi:MAG: hypothetical protein HPY73_07270 [Methanomassiliicoccales archaeon]|nr:MAG: hypothetical protein HPY73_07270 [Methanomassiliicoccales archaeon]